MICSLAGIAHRPSLPFHMCLVRIPEFSHGLLAVWPGIFGGLHASCVGIYPRCVSIVSPSSTTLYYVGRLRCILDSELQVDFSGVRIGQWLESPSAKLLLRMRRVASSL